MISTFSILLIYLLKSLTTSIHATSPRNGFDTGYAAQMQSRAVDTGVDMQVFEGQPIGTVVGNIPIKPGFTYRFNEQPIEFSLDSKSGEIKTSAVLDRESINHYALVVLSSQPTYPIEVRIKVMDLNDNYPEFPEPSIAVSFSESAAPGTKVLLDSAIDKDLGENGIIKTYRIMSGDHEKKFRLNTTVNPSGQTSYLHLETTGKLDRETTDFYVLNISARDGANPPKYGYLQVNVTILDVNDNPPIFDQSDFSVSLNETVPPGTEVLKVTATDSDLGENARITYSVAETEKQFTVHPDTGIISTIKKLKCPKYCGHSSCNMTCVLTVIARDHGTPRQDSRTYVTINLIDTNDHEPVITFTYVPATASFATVDENAKNGSVVAAITVIDLDEGLNGKTSIKITSGNEHNHFRLESSSSVYIVHVNGILDREEISKYNLTMVAEDKGSPPKTSTAFLIINVNDVNDHEPVFEKSEYSAVLSELVPAGTYVASITATDADTGVNAEIYYDFYEGNINQWFLIDHVSGLVTTQMTLDREREGSIELNISARDGGPNPKWAFTTLKITILDENDEAPKFIEDVINVTLSENNDTPKDIFLLNAIDHDQGTNGSISYSLHPEVNEKYPDTFKLDAVTGQLSIKIKLDREKISNYNIKVIAKDQGNPPQSSTATVLLHVKDVNDNSPIFYPEKYFVSLGDKLNNGAVIVKVKARDIDEGENADLIYSLETDGEGLFNIEPHSGNIMLQKSFNDMTKAAYKIIVSARDRGGRRSKDNALVEIIKFPSQKYLEFDSYDGYEFRIVEDSSVENIQMGRYVGKIYASSQGDTITYSILEGDEYKVFKIQERSGIITTNAYIDREEKLSYSLKVLARGGFGFGITTVNISILDINDNPPIFSIVKEEIKIPENMAVGYEVYFARATDRDSGENRTISYGLTINPDHLFRISEASGVIYLNNSIKYKPGTSITIEVTAADNGRPSLSSKISLVIYFDDVNDHTPVFEYTSYETSLLESIIVNTRFFSVSATDSDLGENSKISYSISDGNTEGKFGIFPDGYLYVKSQLDREEKHYYSLTVTAKDSGKPSRTSQVPLIIHILDENDNNPMFSNTSFSFNILENEPTDTFVGKLYAYDKDIGRNAELTYSISTIQNDFVIDKKDGFIRSLRSFDREDLMLRTAQNIITFSVKVNDNGKKKLFDTAKVNIAITDVNDNEPVFQKTPYNIVVSEGVPVGSSVWRVYATDKDEGLNGDVFYKLLSGDDGETFNLDEATGELIINKELDRESKNHYELNVLAFDAGVEKQLSSTTTISISILDENDNAPQFLMTDTVISVIETEAVNNKIIQFHATDRDIGINGEISYSLTYGNRRDTFFIDPISGILYLHKKLDYEEITRHVLNITASDGGNPSLSTTLTYTVNVIDANDNHPIFTNTAIVRQIREGIPIHTPIVTVTAEDPDSGVNGKVYYAIKHQDPFSRRPHFGIDNQTGIIYTLRPIDRETIDTFRLTVQACDMAEPVSTRLTAEKIVTVIVEDINDNSPIFVSMNAGIVNAERLKSTRDENDIYIMTVCARDLDSNTNGLVTYKLTNGGTDIFNLHRSTGVLSFRHKPKKSAAKWNLIVRATDEAVQKEQKSTETYITIVSGGKQLNNVVWSAQNETSVLENEQAGTPILNVTVKYPNKKFEYYITNVTSGGKQVDKYFDIDAGLGILSTAVSLDRESGLEKYEVEISAITYDDTIWIAVTKVHITIMDENDCPPIFKNIPSSYSVSEDLGPGQQIVTIKAEDPDANSIIKYSLQREINVPFDIEESTGILKLTEPIDRETQSEYQLIVRASDGIQYSEATITIVVLDANDNPPIFSESAYSFDILENAPRGTIVGTVSAIDPDFGANARLTYTVISDWGGDVFSLNPQTGAFTLTSRLDYEEIQHYIMVIQAQDAGHPALSSTVTVYCNIIDLNDNSPIFDPMSYSQEVYENIQTQTSIITVSATDLDSDENGELKYKITAGDEKNDFSITDNGTIFNLKMLDRETKSVYNLIITVSDQAQPSNLRLTSTVPVTIFLKDVNDMAPEFLTKNEVFVTENCPPNTPIMTIKAIDKDEGRNGYVEYYMSSEPNTLGVFSLGSVDGVLKVNGRIDRETKSEYRLTITAKDRGEPSQFSELELKVIVLDENDNSPTFDPKQYSSSVPENASIGMNVLQVSATDVDQGLNGKVRYLIVSGDENRDFSISEDTGILRVAKNLNYERISRYKLIVRAEDCSNENINFDTAEISIMIQDINDNPPAFLDSPYLAYVMENTLPPNDGYILTVKAFDADTPPFNNQVRYFIKEGYGDMFRINASSGQISLIKTLDREMQDEYSIALVAMDTGSPPLTGSGTVKITVQDVNDHSPEFERQTYSATVAENSPIGTTVLKPLASDKDFGINAKIKYSILGDKSERFSINQDTGVITTKTILDREEKASYFFILMAQDSAKTDPKTATANFSLLVSDENDNAPTFSSTDYEILISGKTKKDDFVFGAKAQDSDDGLNKKIKYQIKGEDKKYFSINENTGVIKSKLKLSDISDYGIFSLTLIATDRGRNPKQNSAQLKIFLKPDEKFPKFNSFNKLTFELSEDVSDGVMVTRLYANPAKQYNMGSLVFSVAGGNVGDALRIESITGEIFVTANGFDYETMPFYEIWFDVRNSEYPLYKSAIELEVKIIDANDNAPMMELELYNAHVMEEEPAPQSVIKIVATDKDSGDNGKIKYRLRNNHELFDIDEESGEIFTNDLLDREKNPVYEIVAEAFDLGVPELVGTCTILLTVLDKNDNPPRFTRLFSVNVTENSEVGSFVIKVTSSDLDLGINAVANYSFTDNPGNKFVIDPISGNVTVSGYLDREQRDEYILRVAATDGAWTAETPLTISIQDQNDNAPEFEYSYYSLNFPELQKRGTFVGQVIAIDRDKQGPNSMISYSFLHSSDLFSIDPATGEIFSKNTIKYKKTNIQSSPENTYTLTVVATDNGKPPMSSECLISINIINGNNNRPEFEYHDHISPIPENTNVGERIIKLHATDKLDYGINAEIEYSISGGNATEYLKIDKRTGWISLDKPIKKIGKQYQLFVKAADKGYPPQFVETAITFVVTGQNEHKPLFTALSYQVIVPENEPIGSTILNVSATDDDDGPNGIIRYFISNGNQKNKFSIDPILGSVKITEQLDYDTTDEYHLELTAHDLGYKQKQTTAMLTIILTDINDNPPVFNQSEYISYLPENSPINTLIFQMYATDVDSPKNSVIRYYIISPKFERKFEIDHQTGNVYSKVTFDFEQQTKYELHIMAENPDTPMKNTTKLIILITGVNEFYPKFIQPVFHFDVSETSEIGTEVGKIKATDQDSGEDGKIYYLLVGASNDKGFTLDKRTGMVKVSRYLDRETQNRVALNIIAKNKGPIRGNDTDEAQIIINIQDGNDPPVFQQNIYEASVSEGVTVGMKFLTVRAFDKDIKLQNNQFGYSILSGDEDRMFKIDFHSGEIETNKLLDREKTSSYRIIIGAIDTGIPPQTGTTTVLISVSDINDNGPIIENPDNLGSVYENELPNTIVTTVLAIDPDLPPNGAPFTYHIVGGNHRDYVTIGPKSGVIKTNTIIDRELTPVIEVEIEVEDNGSPSMKSRYRSKINILDRNDNEPTSRTVHVEVYTFENSTMNYKIANVRPNDLDISGDYRCSIFQSSTPQQSLDILQLESNCDLIAKKFKPGKNHSLSIYGNDGIHSDVPSSVSVEFFLLSPEVIKETVGVKIYNISTSLFLSKYYNNLKNSWSKHVRSDCVVSIINIQEIDANVILNIVLKNKYDSRAQSKEEIIKILSSQENYASKLINRKVIAPYFPCDHNTCKNGGKCKNAMKILDDNHIITESEMLIITTPALNNDFDCSCSDGFKGKTCDKQQDPCEPNPCLAGGQCRRYESDFICICPVNKEGKLCDLEKADVCSSSPCKNGGSCKESQDRNSHFCLCRAGYRGSQCETVMDSCRPNPCLHGGICTNLQPGYKCSCIDGRYGKHCGSTTIGFNEMSFMKFPSLDSTTNDINIVFSTTKPNSLLLYNFGTQTGGRSDFVALELIRGKAVFSFGGSRTSVTSISVAGERNNLSDGNWYRLSATRNGKVISLSVSNCMDNGDSCDDCLPGNKNCYVDEIGPSGTLNFNGEPVLIGGISKADPILERPGQVHTDDFVGCIHSVNINGKALNLSNALSSKNIDKTCKRTTIGVCSGGNVCGDIGKCIDRWTESFCDCGNNLISPNCGNSLDSVTISNGGYIEYKITEKHRRMQLLDFIYGGTTAWHKSLSEDSNNLSTMSSNAAKSVSFVFKTIKKDGMLFYAGTDKYFTKLELSDGEIRYTSKQSAVVNMTTNKQIDLTNGQWHNITIYSYNRVIQLYIDNKQIGYELDAVGVHDFLDPYLTELYFGGLRQDLNKISKYSDFEGCFANFSINNEIQPFNGSGSIFSEVVYNGKVMNGCNGPLGVELNLTIDPLNVGISLVIAFFVILIAAILISFIVFRLRKQKKEKQNKPSQKNYAIPSKHLSGGPNIISLGNDILSNRSNETNLTGYSTENGDILRNHHLVGPELLSKKYKEREIIGSEHQRSQRPDIIEREVLRKSPALRDDQHPLSPPTSNQSHHTHDHSGGLDLSTDILEHYDLENASSIAPSDIDIIYHYKGYREGMRKYKATPPSVGGYHHKHQTPQHKHSPHHTSSYPSRTLSQTNQSQNNNRQLQSTPLARLSPSSEMSSQQPRILTLHDISGKPLQTALLATTSSSGGVGKDVLHSNSERSLNSPVMSQLSGSSNSRKTPGAPLQAGTVSPNTMSLTTEEIERLNARQRSSTLVSTLDAVSSSSEAPRGGSGGHHLSHRHTEEDDHSSTSSDESGNDSFTCSEIEYDNNSVNTKVDDCDRRQILGNTSTIKPSLMPQYDAFNSSFRGSLSTLVASDDYFAPNVSEMLYNRQPDGSSAPPPPALGWNYLLNWGPNFESMVGVFKDIAELPDSLNGRISSGLRLPNCSAKPSEEYV